MERLMKQDVIDAFDDAYQNERDIVRESHPTWTREEQHLMAIRNLGDRLAYYAKHYEVPEMRLRALYIARWGEPAVW